MIYEKFAEYTHRERKQLSWDVVINHRDVKNFPSFRK